VTTLLAHLLNFLFAYLKNNYILDFMSMAITNALAKFNF